MGKAHLLGVKISLPWESQSNLFKADEGGLLGETLINGCAEEGSRELSVPAGVTAMPVCKSLSSQDPCVWGLWQAEGQQVGERIFLRWHYLGMPHRYLFPLSLRHFTQDKPKAGTQATLRNKDKTEMEGLGRTLDSRILDRCGNLCGKEGWYCKAQ